MGVSELNDVKAKISAAAKRYGKRLQTGTPALIAVSKTCDSEAIRPLLHAGHRLFGESRIQESQHKWPLLKKEFPGVELHFIGPLQTNKVRDAVALFDVIHSVDREKLARALALECAKVDKWPPVFVQVNIGNEPQKAGILPDQALDFAAFCRNSLGLGVEGLMCIPPVNVSAAPYFAQLKGLAAAAKLDKLSMGMSSDYEVAVEMGATHVRVGSAIFGKRASLSG